MKFGIREVCDCVFKKSSGEGPDCFTIDTAKMSTLETSSTTVYAQGGQGYSRLLAWEGEKVVTFTVEDALLSMDAFHALTGATTSHTSTALTYKVKTTSFAGYYSVEAKTLFRDAATGEDLDATLKFPKVKLQTTLNLSMAPTGDPSAFTFTFDAFPDAGDEFFSITVDIPQKTGTTDIYSIQINKETAKSVTASAVLLELANGTIQANDTTIATIPGAKGLEDANGYTFTTTLLTAPGTYSFTTVS